MEPEGTVEIKFRRKDLVKTMRRVDPVYLSLAERLGEFSCSILIIALYRGLHPHQAHPHLRKEQCIRLEHASFHCCSCFDCINLTALPQEMCQPHPGASAQPIDFSLSSEQLCGLCAWGELVKWRELLWCGGFESLQMGIDRN